MTLQEFSDTFDTLLSAYANKPEEYGNQGSLRDIDLDEYEKSVLLTQAQDLVVKSYFDAKYNQYRDGMDDSTRRQVDFSSLITVAHPLRVTGTAGGWAEDAKYFKNTYNTLQGTGNSYTYYKLIINFGNGIVTEAPYTTMTGGGRTIIMNVGGANPKQYFTNQVSGKPFGATSGVDHSIVNLGISLKKRDGKVVGVNVTTTSNAGNKILVGSSAQGSTGSFTEYTKSVSGNTTVYTVPVTENTSGDNTWKFTAKAVAIHSGTASEANEKGYTLSKWNDGTTDGTKTFSNAGVSEDAIYYAQFDSVEKGGITFSNSSTTSSNYLGIFSRDTPVLDASSITLVSQYTTKLDHYDERGVIFQMPKNILFMLNEKVTAANTSKHYVVVPINYKEYDRQMSRAFAQPFKRQCWRLFQGVDSGIYDLNSEVIPIEGTSIDKYTIRYIRRPCPIILTDLDFSESQEPLNIDGISVATECELNPILHMDILQKAIELAVASKGGTKSTAQQQQQQRAAQQQ